MLLVVLGALLGAGLHPARADAPYFLALGDLPGGAFGSWADGVSGDGSVVVGQGTSGGGIYAGLRCAACRLLTLRY